MQSALLQFSNFLRCGFPYAQYNVSGTQKKGAVVTDSGTSLFIVRVAEARAGTSPALQGDTEACSAKFFD